jgi:twinkle protein
MDISQLKLMLDGRVLPVCEYLLPNGIKDGSEWRVGNTGGTAGKSLGVHLAGNKAGVWADFNSGESGDLIDLWCAVKGQDLKTALDDIRGWLGVEVPEFHRYSPPRKFTLPEKPKCRIPENAVKKYLTENRCISPETIRKYQIGEDGNHIIFPFVNRAGNLALAKRREAKDGAKPVPTAAGCEPILFGWQAFPQNSRIIVLTEGEIDALSLADYGYPALSVPFGGGGGGKQNWIENEFENLEQFEKIYLAMDDDVPGEQAATEIAERLGRHRCYRVILPFKDANECLVQGILRDQINLAFDAARTLDPAEIGRVVDYIDAVWKRFSPEEGDHVGYRMPYKKLGENLLFRPAEVTIWTGATGSGKSQILSDNTPAWIEQGSRICLASLEMKPEETLKRLVKQTIGTGSPTRDSYISAMHWLDKGLLFYRDVGKASLKNLFEVFDYARAKYGCDQFIIDSLMRLGIAGDDYTGQEKVMFEIVSWAIDKNVHIHLVAHSKKGEKGFGVQDSNDIKGAMEIGANAFNIVAIWRNKKLEDKINSGDATEEEQDKPAVVLNVAKQRNGDFEGKVALWFNQDCYQYTSSMDGRMYTRNYVRNTVVDIPEASESGA